MLKQLLIIFFILVNCTANSVFAQDTTKTKLNKWGLALNASNAGMFEKFWLLNTDLGYVLSAANTWNTNHYAFGLMGCHSLKGNKSLRIKAEIANRNTTVTYDSRNSSAPPGTFSSNETEIKQKIINIEPSLIWKNEIGKLTIYEGFSLPIILVGKYYSFTHALETDALNTPTYEGTSSISLPGGFATGPGILSGLNLNIYTHFNIGMEFSFAFLYSDIDGEAIYSNTDTFPSYSSGTHTEKFQRIRYEFSNLNSSINISYSF